MEERQLKDYLKNVMDAERDIEQMKTDLALKCDFNVEDAFRIFECNNCNCLTCDDLKCGLRLLDIYATDSDIRGLMRRFDLNKKGYLNYSDFFDMVVPYERYYRNMVECRNSNNCCPSNCNPDVFMFSTKLALKNLFKSLIDYENKCNNMKSCYSSLRCKLRDVFRNLDQCSFGSFSCNDLQCYLQKNCVMGNSKDADLLFIRLDKNRDGKVDYCEFEDELQTQY
jgi:Ca2+-binding EF-hand superfamily protein